MIQKEHLKVPFQIARILLSGLYIKTHSGLVQFRMLIQLRKCKFTKFEQENGSYHGTKSCLKMILKTNKPASKRKVTSMA